MSDKIDSFNMVAGIYDDWYKHPQGKQVFYAEKEAMEKMILHDWPGNVRELRNALERAVVMGNGKEILPKDLPFSFSESIGSQMSVGLSLEEAINDFKKDYIALTLEHTRGNRTKASEILNIQRTYLSRLISRYNLRETE